MLKWGRMKDAIKGIYIDSEWSEDPTRIKDIIKKQFKERFNVMTSAPIRLDNIEFSNINEEDNNDPLRYLQNKKLKWQCVSVMEIKD